MHKLSSFFLTLVCRKRHFVERFKSCLFAISFQKDDHAERSTYQMDSALLVSDT